MLASDITHAAKTAATYAPDGDREGRLHPETVKALRTSGLLRHFVPAGRGGDGGTFTDALGPLVQLGRADPAAGWCAALMMSAARMATNLPPAGQHALWADDTDAAIAATFRPAGTATVTPDGWILDGQWPYVSGISVCRWVLLSTTTTDATSGNAGHGAGGEQRFMLVPQQACAVLETWDALGLRATGTHTVSVTQTPVPSSHSFTGRQLARGGSPDRRDTPSCDHRSAGPVPHESVSGMFFAAPMLGAAQSFFNTCLHALGGRRSADHLGLPLAKAAGCLDAAEALLRQTASIVDAERPASALTQRCRMQYATTAELISDATALLFRNIGTRGVDNSGALARLWRDLNTGLMHPALSLTQVAAEYTRSISA